MFQLIVTVLLCVAGILAGIASAYYFLRARRQEATAPDPADTIVEMRALGQRIETLVGQQQLQGETARHQMAQKMEAVVEHVNQQRTHVSGLHNELRHEVRRRDAEMEEIRHQLTSIQQMATRTALPAAALPPAPETPAPETPAPETAPAPSQPPVAERSDAFEIAAFEPLAPSEPAPEPALEPIAAPEPADVQAMGDGFAASFSDDGWDVGVSPAATPPASPQPAADLPAFVDPFALAPETPSASSAPFDAAPGVTFEDVTPEEPGALEAPALDVPAFETPTFEMPAFEPPAFETPAFAPQAFQAPAFAPSTFSPTTPSAPASAAPASAIAAPPSETAWVARADRPEPSAGFPTFEVPTFDAPAADVPAPAAPDPAAPFVAPAGADRLTVISSIDEPMQQALYMAGVTTLDEIARWSRTDARRVSSTVAVSEETILNQWVFEAQAALFQSFSTTQR